MLTQKATFPKHNSSDVAVGDTRGVGESDSLPDLSHRL